MAPLSRDNKALNAKHAAILRDELKRHGNKICADCKRNDARWASTNLGVYICIRCSGIHRGMGVHISRIKSIDLDTWLPEQVANVQKWGNIRANAFWEAHLKEGHVVPEHKIEPFIRSKYESKRWAKEGPLPEDPSVLDGPGAASSAATEPAAAPATGPRPVAKGASGIDLLGGDVAAPSAAAPSRAQPAAQKAAPAPAATSSGGGGLFDLDFSPQATASAATQQQTTQRTAAKADILSLFSAPPPTTFAPPQQRMQSLPQQQQQVQQPQQAFDPFGSFGSAPIAPAQQQPSSSGRGLNSGFAGMNLNAGADPWSSAPAPQQQQSSNGMFNSHDIWGGAGTTSSNDAFGDFSTTTAKQPSKSDDAFGSIWT